MIAAEGSTEEGQDANMKSMIQASAAAEVARIQHMTRIADSSQNRPFALVSGTNSKLGHGSSESCREDSFGSNDSFSYTFGNS